MEINNKDIIEKDDDIKIIDIKNTEEFKKNLDMILNQTIIDKERASFLLEKNNNDVFNTLIEILDESKSEKKIQIYNILLNLKQMRIIKIIY